MKILKIKLIAIISTIVFIAGFQNNSSAQYSHFPHTDGKAYISGKEIILRTFPDYKAHMVMKNDGTIGIGTNSTISKVDIKVKDQEAGLTIRNGNYGNSHFPWTDGRTYINGREFIVRTNGEAPSKLRVDEEGRVLVGDWKMMFETSNSNNPKIGVDKYKLFVETGILTEKCKVSVKTTNHWADYVFEEDYEMMGINELEDYVAENKHLPNVPSAEEMVENGLDVAKMDAKLLEKIEEAYLYIIDLNKKVDALAIENNSLKCSLQSLTTSGN